MILKQANPQVVRIQYDPETMYMKLICCWLLEEKKSMISYSIYTAALTRLHLLVQAVD